jgi:hypothetical protein
MYPTYARRVSAASSCLRHSLQFVRVIVSSQQTPSCAFSQVKGVHSCIVDAC